MTPSPPTMRVPWTRLALLGASALAVMALTVALHGASAEGALAATEPRGEVHDRVLEGLLVGKLDDDDTLRALRYLTRLHPDEPTRVWARGELASAMEAPRPEAVVHVLAVPAPEGSGVEVESAAAATVAATAISRSDATPVPTVVPVRGKPAAPAELALKSNKTVTKVREAAPDPARKERGREATPHVVKAKVFDASTWLPRADLSPVVGGDAGTTTAPEPPVPTGEDAVDPVAPEPDAATTAVATPGPSDVAAPSEPTAPTPAPEAPVLPAATAPGSGTDGTDTPPELRPPRPRT